MEDGWYLQSNRVLEGPYQLSSGSWLQSGVILLAFIPKHSRFRLFERWVGRYQLILKDSLSEDEFRRLQVYLRWQSTDMKGPEQGSRG